MASKQDILDAIDRVNSQISAAAEADDGYFTKTHGELSAIHGDVNKLQPGEVEKVMFLVKALGGAGDHVSASIIAFKDGNNVAGGSELARMFGSLLQLFTYKFLWGGPAVSSFRKSLASSRRLWRAF
jgi:hypothetical protein